MFHSYTDHFKAWGVEVWQFKKLVKLDGCRFRKLKKGEVVVQSGKPLNDVLMVVKGEVGAEDPTQPSMSRPPLYTYRGDGTNGCVIGGTALVDTKVQNSNYPNRLVAMGNGTVVVKWDRKKLISVMESDKDIESAFLHALYVELIQGLRRDETAQELKKNRRNKLQRRAATRKTTAEMMSDALLEMERNVEQAIQNAVVCKKSNKSAKEGQVWLELNPADKKNIRLFTSENRITLAQRQSVLNRFGWSPEEWEDGGKLVESVKR